MSGWDDYYEPSEFDEAMMEIKQTIIDNVRQEIKDKIQRLEKENEELRDIKENWKQLQKEHENAVRELRIKTENAEREAKRLRAKEILNSLSVVGYMPSHEYKKGPKCDRCDEDRKIHFVSPMGRQMKEDCLCSKGIVFYFPEEAHCLQFDAGDSLNSPYFTKSSRDRDCDTWSLCSDVYKELPENLEKINSYRAVFLSKDDCQKYCDWKNEKGREKNE